MSSEQAGSAPPLKFIVRTKTEMKLYRYPIESGAVPIASAESDRPSLSSFDGTKLAVVTEEKVAVVDSTTGQTLREIVEPDVTNIQWSPRGTYLMTWNWLDASDVTNPDGNVAVWRVADGKCVYRFMQRDTEKWPSVKWSQNERFAVQLAGTQLRLFEEKDPSRYIKTATQRNALSFAVSPNGDFLAVGAPDKGGKPAEVRVYALPELKMVNCMKVFGAEEFLFQWSPSKPHLLVEASVAADKTGGSYYGQKCVYLIHAGGTLQTILTFGSNKGPLHDAQWSPDGKYFAVIQGHHPAVASLWLPEKCVKKFEFGKAPWNQIYWSPHGRFLALCGFNGLQGQMHFWDVNKRKRIGLTKDTDAPTHCSWSPDSRRFVTATVRPLRQIDNNYKIWSYAGEPLSQVKFEWLFQANFMRASAGVYPNRPMSPRLKDRKIEDINATKAQQAYIPPWRRGKAASATTLRMREERKLDGPRKIRVQATGQASKNAEKNRRKRERRRRKAAASAQGGDAKSSSGAAAVEEKTSKGPVVQEAKPLTEAEREKINKRMKAVRKKLKQISALEGKDRSSLNTDQVKKIKSKPGFEKELAQLKARVAAGTAAA